MIYPATQYTERGELQLLSIIFGTAFEVPANDPITEHQSVRVYRVGDRAFIGEDTHEILHVCDNACAQTVLMEWSPPSAAKETDKGDSYVLLSTNENVKIQTADVQDFDPGDDPYVLCAACETELLRDDDKFEAEYGHRIGE